MIDVSIRLRLTGESRDALKALVERLEQAPEVVHYEIATIKKVKP